MIPVHAAAACIKAHIAPAAMLDEPKYDKATDEWFALVTLSPWGPLVTMSFKLSVHCATVQKLSEKERNSMNRTITNCVECPCFAASVEPHCSMDPRLQFPMRINLEKTVHSNCPLRDEPVTLTVQPSKSKTLCEVFAAEETSNKCTRCDGCGQIADSDDGQPWSTWLNMPLGSSAAVLMGLVKPVACPVCAGTGKKP